MCSCSFGLVLLARFCPFQEIADLAGGALAASGMSLFGAFTLLLLSAESSPPFVPAAFILDTFRVLSSAPRRKVRCNSFCEVLPSGSFKRRLQFLDWNPSHPSTPSFLFLQSLGHVLKRASLYTSPNLSNVVSAPQRCLFPPSPLFPNGRNPRRLSFSSIPSA